MPEEPVQTDPTPPSSVASGLTRVGEGSGLSSSAESSDDDSEEERERKLKDLQEQVYYYVYCNFLSVHFSPIYMPFLVPFFFFPAM